MTAIKVHTSVHAAFLCSGSVSPSHASAHAATCVDSGAVAGVACVEVTFLQNAAHRRDCAAKRFPMRGGMTII
jgi:hypothetical protein